MEKKLSQEEFNKKCAHCKKWLPATKEFFSYKNKKMNLWSSECKQCEKAQKKAYQKAYRQRPEVKAQKKAYQKAYQKAYRQRPEAKAQKKAQEKAYQNKRYHTDPNYKWVMNIRILTGRAYKGNIKPAPSEELLGCSSKLLQLWLVFQFKPGMTLENHGNGWNGNGKTQWHIDHIRPLASFDCSIESERRQACHWTNLQPLWAEDNLSKSDN